MQQISRNVVFAVCGLICVTGIIWSVAIGDEASNSDRIKHGEHLIKLMGCSDCHTPWTMGPNGPEPDMSRYLSGHPQDMAMPPAPSPQGPWMGSYSATFTAWSGPWGVSYTRNLTPEPETGLGKWTEENFMETLRTGRQLGKGRMLLPPMPVFAHVGLTDDEMKDMYAFLQSIPAVKNKVPEPVPPAAPPAEHK